MQRLFIVLARLGGWHSWWFETDQQIGNEECQHRSHHNPLFTKKNVDNRIAGMIILGGGLIKHHICNANLMRNGADFSLFVNTASEFDGSDSGARWDYKYFHKPDKNKPNFCFLGPMRRSPGERSERTQPLWKCTLRLASFSLSLWLRLLQRGIIRNKLKVFPHPHTLGHNYEAPSYQESLNFGKSFCPPL